MSEIKFTKKALRGQEQKLNQLQIYLPTLQLKKKLLQFEVMQVHIKIEEFFKKYQKQRNTVDTFSDLFSQKDYIIKKCAGIKEVKKTYENIAGIEIPSFEKVIFEEENYSLFDTPAWLDSALLQLKGLIETKQKINVEEEKKRALLKELKEISIRVNLFEKILIPRTLENINKIKIFLSDQLLAAVAQAKVAKAKILEKKKK